MSKAPKRAWSATNQESSGGPSKKIRKDDDSSGMICSICYEQYVTTGEHFLISLKCGHLFGNSCVQNWFQTLRTRVKTCPYCKSPANDADIRKIFAHGVVAVDNSRNVADKSELRALQQKFEKLKAFGIEYLECEICDHPFMSADAKEAHKIRNHQY